MPKQLINVLGTVVVVAVLVAGILLVGVPMVLQAAATNAQTAQVAQSNDVYQTQVDALREQEEHLDELTAEVAALQSQIPATAQSDDVFEIVANAATAADVTVVTVTSSDPVAWTRRTGILDGLVAEVAPDPDSATDSETEAATEPGGDAIARPTSPQLEVPFTITISTDDPAKASAFLDELGMGPRLIGIDSSTLTAVDPGYQLEVEATSFVRTEA